MFPACRSSHILCLAANEKDFSLSLEMTIWGKRYPRIVAFPIVEGGPRSGARVLSYIACLRRSSSLFFIPLEPYPARSARHLPHAGKAVCQEYRFPHPTSAPSGHLLPKEGGSIHASPFPWKGLPSAARRGWLPQQVEKEWKETFPRFVIPSAAEGSFSFPVSVFFRNAVCMKHRPSDSLEARCFPLAAILTSFA